MLTESDLAGFWRSAALRGREMRDAEGNPLRVLHPGLPDCGGGPDFRGAAIAILTKAGSPARCGDVELHTDSRLWRQHGHHRDPRFNRVILHVVLEHSGSPTMLESGASVPVLPLGGLLHGRPDRMPCASPHSPPCRRCGRSTFALSSLMGAGLERLRLKADACGAAIAAGGPGQALYAGIMEALGYAANRGPFGKLAARAPLSLLEGLPSATAREALLLGTAGLLDRKAAPPPAMCAAEWDLAHVRPANSPLRRLSAMARLTGTGSGGLLERATAAVKAVARQGPASAIDDLLIMRPCPVECRGLGAALIGPGRAAEITVNAILPFALAWSERGGGRELGRAALRLYLDHPAPRPNRLTRYVAAQLWGEGSARPPPRLTAAAEQGLIHIYRSFCSLGRCSACPLG